MERSLTNRTWLWLVPLLLLCAVLAARLINTDILFVDEYWSIRNAGGARWGPMSPAGIWEQTAEGDPGGMGVLYHLLLAAWYALVGDSVFALRAFSLVFGLLSVALLYRLGRDAFSPGVGLYAAVLMAFSAFFIDYMHEGRAYTLMAFLVILSVWLYVRVSQSHRPPWWGYLALVLSIAAMSYTHYVALAVGGFLGLLHLLRFRPTARWWRILAALILGAVAFLPWAGITLGVIQRGAGETTRHVTSMQSGQVVEQVLHAFSSGNIGLLLVLLIFAIGVQRLRAGFAWLWLIIVLLAVLIVNAAIPFVVHVRYLIVLWPAMALLAALGVHQLAAMGVKPLVVLFVWVLMGTYQSQNPAFISGLFGQIYRAPAAGFNQAIDTVDVLKQEGDMLLAHFMPRETAPFALFPMGYYFDRLGIPYDQPERMNNSFAGGDNEYLSDVNISLDGAQAVWRLTVPEVPVTNRSGVVDFVLRSQYLACGRLLDRADIQLDLYQQVPDADPTAAYELPAGQLSVFSTRPIVPIAGRLYPALIWQADEAVPQQTYAVSLQLLDEGGQLVQQADYPLPDARPTACNMTPISMAGLAAGDYALYAIVYDRVSGLRMNVNGNDKVLLATIALG